MSADSIAAFIDHTLLKPEATRADVVKLCKEANAAHFASVCVNPCWVSLAAAELHGGKAKVCTVIGFPLGANDSETKLGEARLALAQGARELDMVINLGALRAGEVDLVEKEITDLGDIAHGGGALLKVIIETCLLNDEQKTIACQLALRARADFVKTSTGFSTGGATEADVRLMRGVVGSALGVKASGGIRSLETFKRMVDAGASRIGTSSGLQILAEYAAGAVPTQQPAAADTY